MRKKPLPRYRISNLDRRALEKGAWNATHPDFRSMLGNAPHVMYRQGLAPMSDLPEEELRERYIIGERRSLQARARAQDLTLFEANPDDPEHSILFADAEILFCINRNGWQLGYMQPSGFDTRELHKASMYAQVVAALYPQESSEFIVAKLRETSSYRDWKKLEKSGAVIRGEEGITIRRL